MASKNSSNLLEWGEGGGKGWCTDYIFNFYPAIHYNSDPTLPCNGEYGEEVKVPGTRPLGPPLTKVT